MSDLAEILSDAEAIQLSAKLNRPVLAEWTADARKLYATIKADPAKLAVEDDWDTDEAPNDQAGR